MDDNTIEQLKKLAAENANLKAETLRKTKKLKRKDEETAKLQESLNQVLQERDSLKRSNATPSDLQAELDKLRGELRNRDHKDAWKQVAADAKIVAELEDVWKLTNYTPDDEAPDVEKIKAFVHEEIVTKRPFLLAQETKQEVKVPVLNGGPGLSKGASISGDAGVAVFSLADKQPGKFHAIQSSVAKALKEGKKVEYR